MAPRWLVRLLERVVPGPRIDDVVGDLDELHRRRIARLGRGPATLGADTGGPRSRFIGVLAEGATVEQALEQIQGLSDRRAEEVRGMEALRYDG